VTGDFLTEVSYDQLASCDAAFSCLLRLAGQSGGNEIGAVHCRNVVNGDTLSISRLIELAGDFGLKAEHARLDWQRLQALGSGRPLLAVLKNTNVIVLTVGGSGGLSEVAVWDPLNQFGEILFVPREDFERAWTGHTLIITTSPSNGAETSPSLDFCWFTSAGLELLGKTSAGGQNPKPPVQKREKTGARRKQRARRTPRQTDRAIVLSARGELDLVRVELANEEMLPDPTRGAQLSTPALSYPAAERSRSQPLASGPFCFEIQPPARSRPPLRSRRRCGQLRPRARGQLTAASAVFRGLVLLPSSQHPLPQPPTDTASQHPLPHPPTDTAAQRPLPHPPTDTAVQHPLSHPPTDTAPPDPLPYPPTDTASHPLPHSRTDAASQHPPRSQLLQRRPPSPPHPLSSPPHQASRRRRPPSRASQRRRHRRTPRQLPRRQRLAPGCQR